MKVDIILRNVEFPDEFQPPENFDFNDYDSKCRRCPFYFPGEDWVNHFCRLTILERDENHPCPLYCIFKE